MSICAISPTLPCWACRRPLRNNQRHLVLRIEQHMAMFTLTSPAP
jgi:hypothetical protein